MYCVKCGHQNSPEAAFCSVCGTPRQAATAHSPYGSADQPSATEPDYRVNGYAIPARPAAVQKAPNNIMCVLGFVISLISLLLNFFGLVGIAATIVSVIGLSSAKQKNENGRALAVAGIVIGVISICYGLYAVTAL